MSAVYTILKTTMCDIFFEPGHTSIKCNVRSERLAGSFARGKWKSKMDDADILNAGVHTCPMSVRGTSWVLQM